MLISSTPLIFKREKCLKKLALAKIPMSNNSGINGLMAHVDGPLRKILKHQTEVDTNP